MAFGYSRNALDRSVRFDQFVLSFVEPETWFFYEIKRKEREKKIDPCPLHRSDRGRTTSNLISRSFDRNKNNNKLTAWPSIHLTERETSRGSSCLVRYDWFTDVIFILLTFFYADGRLHPETLDSSDMIIKNIGNSLSHILPELIGQDISNVFDLTRPLVEFKFASVNMNLKTNSFLVDRFFIFF